MDSQGCGSRDNVRVGRRRRPGVSVFVDNISRRIHQNTLKEAFQVHGRVVEVFIAYNSLKRLGKPTTFAFVRFEGEEDALKAIAKSNGRLMDGFRIRVFPAKQDNPKLCVKSTSFSATQRRVQAGSWKFRDFRTFKEALLGEGEAVPVGMDGKAVGNGPRDMLVKVIDLAPGVGSVVMDNASSDGDALDSEFEYDGCSNEVVVPEGRSKPEPEKVAFDDQGCGLRDSFFMSGESTELGNNSRLGNKVGPVSNALLDLSDSISHRSRLQEVHVGILEEATGQNLGPQDLSGERKSSELNLRAGFDKFNWWVAQSKRKSKAKKIPRSTSHSKKRCVVLDSSSGREPLAISQEQRFGPKSRSPSVEAYKTLEMGTRVGV
ncbi:hypothetical protein V6N11_035228 [Hibiscus sabdariffa]|uniref:RRM domain-containing protein n=1 Tax=Hibiscus sabdariffa TaxID=183260 RepID=A0ABR2QZW6_9ROSI